jgi:glycosyltransferase involved in cell wall biosynthesis
MSGIQHVGVIIPAHNEQRTISACLRSVGAAVEAVRAAWPRVSCEVVVVLDCCTDHTAALVAEHGVPAILSSAGRVGCARHVGAMAVLHSSSNAAIADRGVWLANTDADSTVPRSWLISQLEFASSGLEAVIGTVTPCGLDSVRYRRWHAEHELGEGHPHVHGANLGLRGDLYVRAGGFAPLSVDEDLEMVAEVRRLTDRWIATHRTNVTTSARTSSRIDGGFATYISGLDTSASTCA